MRVDPERASDRRAKFWNHFERVPGLASLGTFVLASFQDGTLGGSVTRGSLRSPLAEFCRRFATAIPARLARPLTSHLSPLTSHFSLLTSHFSLLTSPPLPRRTGKLLEPDQLRRPVRPGH
jgi:hypothetical protein